jgi:hypothetical protein
MGSYGSGRRSSHIFVCALDANERLSNSKKEVRRKFGVNGARSCSSSIDSQSGVTFAVTLNGNELLFLPHKARRFKSGQLRRYAGTRQGPEFGRLEIITREPIAVEHPPTFLAPPRTHSSSDGAQQSLGSEFYTSASFPSKCDLSSDLQSAF